MRAELRLWYDARGRSTPIARPSDGAAFEVTYGLPLDPDSHPLSTRRAGRRSESASAQLQLSGRIDRLQWGEDGPDFVVIDYKTGTAAATRRQPVRRRQRAAAAALPASAPRTSSAATPTDGTAEYFYVSRRGEFARHAMTGRAAGGIGRRVRAGARRRLQTGCSGASIPARPGEWTLQVLRLQGPLPAPDRARRSDEDQGRRTRAWPICSRHGRSSEAADRRRRRASASRRDLDVSMCVEAGAGTGKTTMLVQADRRPAAHRTRDDRPARRDHLHREGGGRAVGARALRAGGGGRGAASGDERAAPRDGAARPAPRARADDPRVRRRPAARAPGRGGDRPAVHGARGPRRLAGLRRGLPDAGSTTCWHRRGRRWRWRCAAASSCATCAQVAEIVHQHRHVLPLAADRPATCLTSRAYRAWAAWARADARRVRPDAAPTRRTARSRQLARVREHPRAGRASRRRRGRAPGAVRVAQAVS